MLDDLDSPELTEWMAWERVNGPLGAERGDWQAATVAMASAQYKCSLSDFMLWRRERVKGATEPEDQVAMLRAMFGGGGSDNPMAAAGPGE